MLRLIPPPGRITAGRIELNAQDLLTLPERELRSIRGDRLALIFQEPMSSLDPLLTVGAQIDEVLRVHGRARGAAARRRTVELLRRVGIPAPERRAREYPHQLSGGMRQRVMIAMALACEPALLIADEPTTALDVTIQAQILALLRELQQATGMGVLFITHDLAVVAQVAHVVYVMYAGHIVEHAPAAVLFANPRHPYTRGLLQSTPHLDVPQLRPRGTLPVIPGDVPTPAARPAGCAFHPRCEVGRDDPRCAAQPPPLTRLPAAERDHECACWYAATQPSSAAVPQA